MSKNVAVFVDVANLYYAAKSAGVDVDYVTLLKGAVKGRDLIRAYAYSGLDPENENQRKFIDFLSKNGYKVVSKDIRKYGDGKIKANLDIELVVDLFRLADRMDTAVIVSGDGDFAPAIRALQDKGVRAEVISFRGNTSSDLIAVADEFMDIMKVVQVGRTKKDAVVAPEMPAKEVTPEFSFREAPPGVAAAARAALRTAASGTRSGTRRPARTGEPPPVSAAAVGSEAEQLAERGEVPFDEQELVPTAGEPAEGRPRRRRRRGGRGRSAADGAGVDRIEPGADDFDALSELDDLGADREYAFSEATDDVLAELGLLPAATTETTGRGAGAASEASAAGEAPAGSTGGVENGDGTAEAARRRSRRGRRGGRGRRPATGEATDQRAADTALAVEPESAGETVGVQVAATGAETASTAEEPRPRTRRGRRASAGERAGTGTATEQPAAADAAQRSPAAPRRATPRRRAARSTSSDGDSGEGSASDAGPGEPVVTADSSASTRSRRAPARRGSTERVARPQREDGASGDSAAAASPRRRAPRRSDAQSAAAASEEADPGASAGGRGDRTAPRQGADTGSDAPQASDREARGIWQRLLSGRKK